MKPTLALMCLVAGCGGLTPPPPAASSSSSSQAALTTCEVPEGYGARHLRATRYGAVFAFDEDGLVARRYAGTGCDLRPDGSKAIAIGQLLGADDLGNVYAFPRASREPSATSTMLPEGRPAGYVARVDPGGRVSNLLEAGRGIWSFGVAPGGDALWFIGCAPGGAYPIRDGVADRTPSIGWPESGASDHSALTDGHTLWTMGRRTCAYGEPLSAGCGHALVRTTADGSTEVGPLVHDLGSGWEVAQLAPCGTRVCGLLPASGGVLVWNADGTLVRALRAAEYGAEPGDAVAELSGNSEGVYLLVRGPRGDARVLFAPVP